MPPSLRRSDEPAEWMRRARSNLARARAGRTSSDVLYEDLCFDAQQAVEKAVKAVLVGRGVAFPKTHGIMDLLSLLERGGTRVPKRVREAGTLTVYAVDSRYPGVSEDVTRQDYAQALKLAKRVFLWAEKALSRKA